MTKSKTPEKKQRRTILRSFTAFNEVEKVISILQKINDLNIEVSLLGPLTETKRYSEKSLSDLELEIKTRCEELFESPLHFGTVSNPEIGSVFITGAFAPIFLQEINEKKIGSMSTGPYSILRGLGIDQERVTAYLKALTNGNYVIIFRGYDEELYQLKEALNDVWV